MHPADFMARCRYRCRAPAHSLWFQPASHFMTKTMTPILGKKVNNSRVPGGPVVRTLHFHCQGPSVQCLVGELRFCKPRGPAQKKKVTIPVAWFCKVTLMCSAKNVEN